MNYRIMKKLMKGFKHTFLHPQFFVYKDNHQHLRKICKRIKGRVLDIGCADQFVRQYLSSNVEYIGLDYYQTATEWYETKPNIFGDAQQLPLESESIDSVFLLDVLEHIPDSDLCIKEITRVLKVKGTLVLQVPFIYPIHDAPLDFRRWTSFGLIHLAKENGFSVNEEQILGKSLETAGLMCNLALGKLLLNWVEKKSPALLLSVFIVPAIFLINAVFWLFALFCSTENFMPHGYCLILEKQPCDT